MHALPFRSQVAGFSAAYEEGLVYATVRGAGHLVPQTQPERALELLTRFLDGEEI
jgi:carboxypeptidase C (cathepsin A)